MPDDKYCYPNSETLINKLNIVDSKELFEAEKKITFIRLKQLQNKPIDGKFNFEHLKEIHRHIFQDIYSWAGEVRTVEIGKGNLFCTTPCIQSYAEAVFDKYYSQCYSSKDNVEDFIRVFANNYGDLNALHPFREGNGRAQREFARLVCKSCGYKFDLSCTKHKDMLEASILSFDKGDSSGLVKIFSKAVSLLDSKEQEVIDSLYILTSDDMELTTKNNYDYYEYKEHQASKIYNEMYEAKIQKMNADKIINEAKVYLNSTKNGKEKQEMTLDEIILDNQKKIETNNKKKNKQTISFDTR